MPNNNKSTSGDSRGEKAAVVTLLWAGTVLAIAGLWFPDWVSPLSGTKEPFLNSPLFKTPVLTYAGEILLWAACVTVVGFYVRRGQVILYLGLFSTIIAIVSSILALTGLPVAIIMILTTVSLFTATIFIYLALVDYLGAIGRLILAMSYGGLGLGIAYSITGTVTLVYAMNATYTVAWLIIAISIIPSHYQAMVEARKNKKE